MKISKQARRDAKTLFRACLQDGLLQEDRVKQAVDAVVKGKPRGYIGVLNHFLRLVKTDIQNRTARVESATALDESAKQSIQQQLSAKYGNALEVSFNVNPDLIGGLRVQVGSDVYDGSIRSRLARLGDSFSAS
jgi:F-type H+-transporting ATPase subunit delta